MGECSDELSYLKGTIKGGFVLPDNHSIYWALDAL